MTSTIRAEIAPHAPQMPAQAHVTSTLVPAKTADQEASTVSRLCGWCIRRRYELAPAAGNISITALAWAQHLAGVTPSAGWAYAAGTLAMGGITSWALGKSTKVATFAGVTTAALAEAGINAMAGPGATGLVATAVTTVGSYAIYGPWLLKHRRKLAATGTASAGGSQGLAAATPAPLAGEPLALAAHTGSPGREEQILHEGLAALGILPLAVEGFTADANGWAALVTLPPGKATSPAAVKAQRTQLASNMGLSGRLRLTPGPNSNQLLVKVDLNDVLAESITWPGPSITSVKQLMKLGLFEDNEEILLDLMKDHMLVAGATDMGKSGVINLILGNLAACSDAVVLGVDMKPGALELGPWESTMLMLADDADSATEVFAAVRSEMNRRGKYLGSLKGEDGAPVRKWIPGDPTAEEGTAEWGHGPAWFLVLDELAELLRQAPDLINELLTLNQVARAMGIRIIAATQSPSAKAFGGSGTDARQQYGTRIGLGVNEPITVNLILGPGAYGAGWALDDLDRPGKLMISNGMHKYPREGRAYWISDAQIVTTARLHAKAGPVTPPGGGGPGGRFLKSVPCFPDGSRIPDNRLALWQAIDRRGAEGITINGLLGEGLVGLNTRTAISDPIQAWKARGWLIEIGTTADRSKVFAVARHVQAA
ncbi:FtsK/SpoIIIE domain-containing protein [Kitasatospora sp. CMC57]|uniref:FtsK/SpoIIIE domain-containing protein n=1 Tax=Kitasatospora sp. CMC57 TaxID=3231513 RepID=UPI0038B4AF9B